MKHRCRDDVVRRRQVYPAGKGMNYSLFVVLVCCLPFVCAACGSNAVKQMIAPTKVTLTVVNKSSQKVTISRYTETTKGYDELVGYVSAGKTESFNLYGLSGIQTFYAYGLSLFMSFDTDHDEEYTWVVGEEK
jgi:hypothetical protein